MNETKVLDFFPFGEITFDQKKGINISSKIVETIEGKFTITCEYEFDEILWGLKKYQFYTNTHKKLIFEHSYDLLIEHCPFGLLIINFNGKIIYEGNEYIKSNFDDIERWLKNSLKDIDLNVETITSSTFPNILFSNVNTYDIGIYKLPNKYTVIFIRKSLFYFLKKNFTIIDIC